MNFKQLLERAKGGDAAAVTELLLMYRPLLLKEAILCVRRAKTTP